MLTLGPLILYEWPDVTLPAPGTDISLKPSRKAHGRIAENPPDSDALPLVIRIVPL